MHERTKLGEARHFLDRMQAERGNLSAFARELSAFIAAARSVLQYAHKEAKSKPRGQQWYHQAIMADPLIAFFRDKRDISIHQEPVNPVRKFTTEVADFLNVGDDDEEMMIPYPHTRVVERYYFHDHPGEEILDLAERYLTALDGLVKSGVACAWITG
jgi:hypothetical protein